MVSTRHHPRAFPEPASPATRSTKASPSKSSGSPRASPPSSPTSAISSTFSTVTTAVTNAANDVLNAANDTINVVTPAKTTTTRGPGRRRKSTRSVGAYAHVVDPIIVIWMFFSLPLVLWDCGYVMFRPLTMPGGSLHLPIYKLYGIYGTVDYMYGWPAYNDGVGFTAAQGALNILETIMYGWYVFVLTTRGRGTRWYAFWEKSFWTEKMVVQGDGVAQAVVICFASAVMTLSKTVLYWLNEYFSKFENIGHNNWSRLFWLWIVPNGLWLLFPTYMCYVLAKEIVAAMHVAKSSGLEKED